MNRLYFFFSIFLAVSRPSNAAILGGDLLTHRIPPLSMFNDAAPIGWVETPIGALYHKDYVTGGWVGAFEEKQSYLLENTLFVDVLTSANSPGSIPIGTRINSHMIFMDPIAGGVGNLEDFTVLFRDGERVVGAASSALRLNSSNYLGNPATTYPTFVAGQGIEASDIILFEYDVVSNLSTMYLTLRDSGPGDWIRVITVSAVPLPPAAFVFISGVVLLARLRRS